MLMANDMEEIESAKLDSALLESAETVRLRLLYVVLFSYITKKKRSGRQYYLYLANTMRHAWYLIS